MQTDSPNSSGHFQRDARRHCSRSTRAVTLVETMIALTIFAFCMLGFLSTFLQSRKVTESNVLHAAATNIVYGIIEQIKNLDYTSSLPCGAIDPADPNSTPANNLRVQINQNTIKWLRVVYTPYTPATTSVVAGVTVTTAASVPKAPLVTPGVGELAADVGGGAIDNVVGPLQLSSASGTRSQDISVTIWIWIDELPDLTRDVTDVKRVTVVYTYDANVGSGIRTFRNREVFLRTRYDK